MEKRGRSVRARRGVLVALVFTAGCSDCDDSDPVAPPSTGVLSLSAEAIAPSQIDVSWEEVNGLPRTLSRCRAPIAGAGCTPTQVRAADVEGLVDHEVIPSTEYCYTVNGFQQSACATTPAPPPASGTIVFDSDRAGTRALFTIGADGSGVSQVGPFGDEGKWSPDGSAIVFDFNQGGAGAVYTMSSSGTGITQLTQTTESNEEPGWSPDGGSIVFTTTRDGGDFEIYTMRSDGTQPMRLTDNDDSDEHPDWSPDGSRIAFDRFTPVTNAPGLRTLWIMDADGTNQAQLTTAEARDPNWSPDGTKIVFDRELGANTGIHVLELATGESTLISQQFGDREPVWSPDGSLIAFVTDRAGNAEIYIMRADGTGATRLTNHPANDGDPHWKP
ncbi:MAG: hypothetical protein MJB57_02135 [Gemmatimonadetes bacterium]|nr:hypothetical protein [Gemmatimonadota bacterium]